MQHDILSMKIFQYLTGRLKMKKTNYINVHSNNLSLTIYGLYCTSSKTFIFCKYCFVYV